jgi:hypothetical protein
VADHHFQDETRVRAPLAKVFSFLSDAAGRGVER